jgi:site-specific recombinase XerD
MADRKIQSQEKEEIKAASVNRELALLKHMDTKAIEWGKCKENPAKRIKLLKGEVKRLRFLMPDEIQRLISNCADHIKPIVTIAIHTGMRRSEILTLPRDQVNFEQRIISILDTNNHERRDIPMN